MYQSSRITATNLAMHTHLQCDMYLHQSYHGMSSTSTGISRPHATGLRESPTAISLAVFASGNTWESALYTRLDQLGLLLTNSGPPLSGVDIASIIALDDRSHFFVAGLSFWPPSQRLAEEYAKHGVKPQHVPRFGLAKPDLLEIWRKDGGFIWRVIEAKASKDVKTPHLVQTYFYYLCLSFMLPSSFVPAPTTAVWLPSIIPSIDSFEPFSSLTTLHPTPIAPLAPPLTELIFTHLPAVLSAAQSELPWHFNPLCRSCPFASTCRSRVKKEGGLGKAGEISLSDADEVRGFMKLAQGITSAIRRRQDVEIEDLVPHMDNLSVNELGETRVSELAQLRGLLQNKPSIHYMASKWPASLGNVRRILALQHLEKPRASSPSKDRNTLKIRSPVIEAAIMNTPHFTNRQTYTLPSSEDIAIYISLIIDPSRPQSVTSISEFCISTKLNPSFAIIARKCGFQHPRHIHGSTDDLIPILSNCIRDVLDLHGRISCGVPNLLKMDGRDRARHSRVAEDLPRTQFYMWSVQEKDALQGHLVNAALGSSSPPNLSLGGPKTSPSDDIRLCIGALCEGASLLATMFQPHVLEGALLGFLGKKGQSKEEMTSILGRLGVELTGMETLEMMRQKIVGEIDRLDHRGERDTDRKTVGLLPRIVVLKKELRRLVALPVAGWWDTKEAAQIFAIPSVSRCPDEDELFRRYWEGEIVDLKSGLEARNDTCQGLVDEIRHRIDSLPNRPKLLVNRARVLSADWVDLCRTEVLRKLFYMRQFEVLLKLQELWDRRIEGCPDAPLLVYRFTTASAGSGNGDQSNSTVQLHHFDLIAGNLEVSSERQHDRAFFDYILVLEDDEDDQVDKPESQLPLEALFDDLSVSGLVFPPSRYTFSKWEDGQTTEVKNNNLWVADIRDVKILNEKTHVVMRTWSGTGAEKALLPGRTYRLSPRLVDFNTTKVLSTLIELDLQMNIEDTPMTDTHLPLFTELISNPKSFGRHRFAFKSSRSFHISVVLDAEASLHRLYTELRDLGNENAGALVPKSSQRRAVRRILSERLTVVWGPPGSGKSYTIALSLLRMVEVQARTRTLAPGQQQIIFIAAMSHAAIQGCLSKLRKIIKHYRSVPHLPLEWLDELCVEHVLTGHTHSDPSVDAFMSSANGGSKARTWIYAGTVYQLYNFGKRLTQGVDCVVIDEAGQLGLCEASLVLRALTPPTGIWGGKVVVAGDREQLAPIFSGKYPELAGEQQVLFGSILDCLMSRDEQEDGLYSTGVTASEEDSAGTVVQLLENFRLNPDLGEFVQTIYKRAFKPQKVQAKLVATRLKRLENEASSRDAVTEKGRNLLLSLSKAMLGQEQSLFDPPIKQEARKESMYLSATDTHGIYADPTPTPRPISLALVRLHVKGDSPGEMAYETHVHTEAKIAAVLVRMLEKACGKNDDIFVACPHRIQRAKVNLALSQWDAREKERKERDNEEGEELQRLMYRMGIHMEEDESDAIEQAEKTDVPITVDTIERLQGSEASFVICLFSHTHRGSLGIALPFLLARRRLNVAISRTRTLCIVISSEGVLRPGVSIFADRESARGYAFLQEFENRAWNTEIEVDIEV